MTTDLQVETTAPAEASKIIAVMREAVISGRQHWFSALLEAIGRWHPAEETVGERTYRYLIGGEAFDWLLLAERLCEELSDLTTPEEREALLFHRRFPLEVREDEFRRVIGPAKYRAHLNFLYGVLVEEALQLVVEEEVQKERLSSRIWENGHLDDEAYQRIYGTTRLELAERFRREEALKANDGLSLGDLKEFTYWLFKQRLHWCEPARVASDTRKGLAKLTELEAKGRRLLSL